MDREHTYRQSCPFLSPGGLPFVGMLFSGVESTPPRASLFEIFLESALPPEWRGEIRFRFRSRSDSARLESSAVPSQSIVMRPLPTKQEITTRKRRRAAGKTRQPSAVPPKFHPEEPSYQASPVKRRRRTKAQTAQLEQQMLEVWAKSREGVRYVYYCMTATNLPEPVEKTDNGYDQVQRLSKKLRDNGRLPWDRVIDASRSGVYFPTCRGPRDFLEQSLDNDEYRISPWVNAPQYVQVWCESRSIAGVLEEVCKTFAVNLFPAGGFTSDTFILEGATVINAQEKRKVTVLSVGDYDDHGMLIDKGKKGIEKKLREFLNPDIELTFKRIAVTAGQIKKYNLPTKPAKKTNLRGKQKQIKNSVEAETMPAAVLQGILRRELEALLPNSKFELQYATRMEERGKQTLRQIKLPEDR
jgi:hypothetical protein